MSALNLIGQRFGRLVVTKRARNDRHNQTRWVCVCECGTVKKVTSGMLRNGHARSCGCLNREMTAARFTKHGAARQGARSVEYGVWCHLRERCNNPRHSEYKNYGGRGIRVADRWLVGEDGKHPFICFLEDVGRRPRRGLSIDRRNNDLGYSKENCRWATRRQQNSNTRRSLRNRRAA